MSFSDCHPDLIEISCDEDRGRIFRVIDVKRSERVKSTHRIQILIYALLLKERLITDGVEGRVEMNEGGVWLNDTQEPKWVSVEIIRAHVERFRKTVTITMPTTHRSRYPHRETLLMHVMPCQEREDDLSPPGVVRGKLFLSNQGLNTIEELQSWLKDEATEVLAESACDRNKSLIPSPKPSLIRVLPYEQAAVIENRRRQGSFSLHRQNL